MTSYVLRRLLLMVPTVIGILTVTFLIIQLVPGGPLEQMKQMLENATGAAGLEAGGAMKPRGGDAIGRRGLSTKDYENLRKVYHLDRPLVERYLRTFVWFSRRDAAVPYPKALFRWENWDGMLLLKFGDSFYRNRNVLELIMKAPASTPPRVPSSSSAIAFRASCWPCSSSSSSAPATPPGRTSFPCPD